MPDLTRVGEDFRLTWEEMNVSMTFHGLYEDKTGVHSETTVQSTSAPIGSLLWERVNLTSGQGRQSAAKRLNERWGGAGAPPWDDMLLQASFIIVKAFRDGEPFIEVGQLTQREAPRYRVDGICPEGQITVLFGDGGTGKSFIAARMALAAQTGLSFLDRLVVPGNVLYLDWETSGDEIDDRIKRLCAALDETPPRMAYRRMIRPLSDDVQRIRKEVDERAVQFVVVDSIGAAVGADPNNAQDVIRCFGAMRALGVTVLAIDHVAKADSEGKPYGSAYKYNYARSAWETRKEQLADETFLTVALLHRKANNGRLSSPIGLRIGFDGDDGPVSLEATDLKTTGLVETLAVSSRILNELSSGKLATDDIIRRMPDLKDKTVRDTLTRLKAASKIVYDQGRWGKAYQGENPYHQGRV